MAVDMAVDMAGSVARLSWLQQDPGPGCERPALTTLSPTQLTSFAVNFRPSRSISGRQNSDDLYSSTLSCHKIPGVQNFLSKCRFSETCFSEQARSPHLKRVEWLRIVIPKSSVTAKRAGGLVARQSARITRCFRHYSAGKLNRKNQ